ncbi:gluconate 2-dehydrogenase subunit 3 family protein [Robiginitalea sp. IMCC43444]|uniref:gluconate 2-dehydrogenase subunit 3 family protein n=1 Tax=Robiginitalea sp. IMCC43444 TaxID=3459121 RepID=UPI004041E394
MDRRLALKNMGIAVGYTVAAPTLLSILQSCQSEPKEVWNPVYFSADEAHVTKQLVDIILPKTDLPSASEMQVHKFLDQFMDQVMELEERDFMRMAMGKFMEKARTASGKETILELTSEDLEPVLAAALVKKSPEDESAIYETLGSYQESVEAGTPAELDTDIACYMFANNLRGSVIWAYKNTEYIGEEVLAYLPVPGEYIGCAPVEELTGGKDWSITR